MKTQIKESLAHYVNNCFDPQMRVVAIWQLQSLQVNKSSIRNYRMINIDGNHWALPRDRCLGAVIVDMTSQNPSQLDVFHFQFEVYLMSGRYLKYGLNLRNIRRKGQTNIWKLVGEIQLIRDARFGGTALS